VMEKLFKAEKTRAAGKLKVTLKDLGLNVSMVVAQQPLSVLMEMEKIICDVTESIMKGEGFKFNVPNRKSTNQIYVPELDRIVLRNDYKVRDFVNVKNARKCAIMIRILSIIYESCVKNIHITKRYLFYQDVKLFTKQNDSDVVLDDVACMVGATRTSLRVIASEKGVVVGCIQFNESGDEIDCMKQGKSGKAIPSQINDVTNIRGKGNCAVYSFGRERSRVSATGRGPVLPSVSLHHYDCKRSTRCYQPSLFSEGKEYAEQTRAWIGRCGSVWSQDPFSVHERI